MKKKMKAPAPLPDVTLFVKVSHEGWLKLTTLAAQAGMPRLALYSMAVGFALSDPKFEEQVLECKGLYKKRAKK